MPARYDDLGVPSTASTYSTSSTTTLYTIGSDEIGNITNIGNVTMDWNGRRLESISQNGTELISYDYNIDGQRVKKTVNGVTTEYFYNGSILAGQKKGDDVLTFMYDNNGDIFGFTYNGTPFYYVKNAQNDVYLILDENGYAQVLYQYDAWGKVTYCVDATDFGLATINPIMYRSYYVDLETGLFVYYLNSRYYIADWGRFASADSYVQTGQGMLDKNMFAYCANNPVMFCDPTGQFWSSVLEFVKTVVIEIGKAMGVLTPAYAGCGGAAVVDGPFPFGDAVGLVGGALLTAGAIGYGIYQASQAPTIAVPKAEEKVEAPVIPKQPDIPVIFPINPNDFNPIGLVKVPRDGTKNGSLISWMDPVTNTEVFRWDENPNYSDGPHYHIYSSGHYIPGVDVVPEPYASIYFP